MDAPSQRRNKMGFIIDLLRAHWEKPRGGPIVHIQGRLDRDLPLGLRIGARVSLTSTPFLLAGEELTMKDPGNDFTVGAYGVVHIKDMTVHRFYLTPADCERAQDLFLQITCEQGGKIGDILLMEEFDCIRPQTPAEWDEWLDRETGMVGQLYFRTPVEYTRSWNTDNKARMEPVRMRERIHPNPEGDNAVEIVQEVMQYGRVFPDARGGEGTEFLLLSHDPDQAQIRILIGIAYRAPWLSVT